MSIRSPWLLRRLTARLVGHGPCRIGAATNKASPLTTVPGESFPAPGPDLLVPTLPPQVSRWPTEQRAAPDRHLHLLDDVALYDDDGVIYDPRTRCAFAETLDYWDTPPRRHPALALPRASHCRRLPGLTIFLGGLGGQTFYHFLIDHLPKLALLRPLFADASRLLVQSHAENNKLDWLRLLGCELPVEWLRPLDHLRCERLAFVTPVNLLARPTPWALRTLRELVPAPAPGARPGRHIWADRRSAPVRATPWESEFVPSLPEPWEAIDFSRLSAEQSLSTMAGCVAFAGLHGAAFANLALAPAGVRVLEILSAPNRVWYPTLSTVLGHEHSILFASDSAAAPAIRAALAALAP